MLSPEYQTMKIYEMYKRRQAINGVYHSILYQEDEIICQREAPSENMSRPQGTVCHEKYRLLKSEDIPRWTQSILSIHTGVDISEQGRPSRSPSEFLLCLLARCWVVGTNNMSYKATIKMRGSLLECFGRSGNPG